MLWANGTAVAARSRLTRRAPYVAEADTGGGTAAGDASAMVIAMHEMPLWLGDHQLAGDGYGEPAAQTTTQPPYPSR